VAVLKEMQVYVGLNSDNKVLFMEPVKKETGKTVETKIMIARLLTQEDIDREVKECMEDSRVYKRVGRRIREIK
jgi:hypothetical protein